MKEEKQVLSANLWAQETLLPSFLLNLKEAR